MRERPGHAPCWLTIAAAVAIGASGCDDRPATDPDAALPPGPEPVAVSPYPGEEDVLVDRVIRVTFDDHLDARTLGQNRVDLESGPLSKWLGSYYDPVHKQLVVWPSSAMRADATWVFSLQEGLDGLDGLPVTPGEVTRFRTGDESGDNQPFAPRDFTDEIMPLFENRCAWCHGGPGVGMGGVRLDSADAISETLIGIAADGWPGWRRVVPGRPGESYALFKIVGDERIAGAAMPRSLQGDGAATPLPIEEQEALSDWIASGAPFFDPEGDGE